MTVPYREGRLLLLLAHRGGQAVPDLLPQEGQPRGAGGGHPRPQRAGRGPEVHVPRRLRGQRRRPPASPTRPTPPASASTRCTSRTSRRARSGPKRREKVGLGGLGRRRQDALLHGRGRADQAPVPALPARARRGHATSSSTRRRTRLQRRRRPHAQQAATCSWASGSHTTVRGALPARRRADAASGRLVAPRMHEQEYDVDHHGDRFYIRTNDTRPQLPAGDGAGRDARAARAGRRSCPTAPDVMLEGVDFFQRPLRAARARGRPARSSGSPTCAPATSHRIAFPEPAYSAFPGANPEFDTTLFRYTLPVAGDAAARVFDYDMETRDVDAAQGAAGAGRLRPRAVRVRAPLRHRAGRRAGPDLARLPEGPDARRHGARCYLDGYGSYGFPLPGHLLVEPAEPARPRRRRSPSPTSAAAASWARPGTTTAA